MAWSLPPQSQCGLYKLIATEKINEEVYIMLLGDDIGALKCSLNDLRNHSCTYLKEYVKSLLPNILSGAYDVCLIDQE